MINKCRGNHRCGSVPIFLGEKKFKKWRPYIAGQSIKLKKLAKMRPKTEKKKSVPLNANFEIKIERDAFSVSSFVKQCVTKE